MPDPFISEVKYRGGANEDFIEIAVDAGTDVSDIQVTVYRSNGTVRSTSDLSDVTPTTVNGRDVYTLVNGDASDFSGISTSQGVALTENGTVYLFISFDNTAGTVTATQGPANGSTSTDVGLAGFDESLETQNQGGSYFTQTDPDPNNVTCFVAGTRIDTIAGPVTVEDLREGTLVRTRDGQFRPVRLIFHRCIGQEELARKPGLWPVHISAGSLGINIPNRDIRVSRQHRMLVSSQITKRMFGRDDVLVAAVRLTDLPGIFVKEPEQEITYYHLLFEDHEVIFAEGAPTESFFLGPVALQTLPKESLAEIEEVFPQLALPLRTDQSKYFIPQRRKQVRLIARHVRNHKNVVTTF